MKPTQRAWPPLRIASAAPRLAEQVKVAVQRVAVAAKQRARRTWVARVVAAWRPGGGGVAFRVTREKQTTTLKRRKILPPKAQLQTQAALVAAAGAHLSSKACANSPKQLSSSWHSADVSLLLILRLSIGACSGAGERGGTKPPVACRLARGATLRARRQTQRGTAADLSSAFFIAWQPGFNNASRHVLYRRVIAAATHLLGRAAAARTPNTVSPRGMRAPTPRPGTGYVRRRPEGASLLKVYPAK